MCSRKLLSLATCIVVVGLFTAGCSSETDGDDQEQEETEEVGTSSQPLCTSPRVYASMKYMSGASPDLYKSACWTGLNVQCSFKRGRLSNVSYAYVGRTTVAWTCSGLCTVCI
jgi:hypothetical protein